MAESVLKGFAAKRYKGLTFDQLNILYDDERDRQSMSYEQYFGEMHLSDRQKEQRQRSAEELEDVFIGLLALVFYFYVGEAFDYTEAIQEAQTKYNDVLAGTGVSDYYREVHVPNTVVGVVNTMLTNPEDPYNFSIDRATMIAENEANSMWNDAEYEEAVRSGRTMHTWNAIIDKETRDAHRDANGQSKSIFEPFEVDGELMMYPRDESLGANAGNIVNCRCSASYS